LFSDLLRGQCAAWGGPSAARNPAEGGEQPVIGRGAVWGCWTGQGRVVVSWSITNLNGSSSTGGKEMGEEDVEDILIANP